MFQYDDAGRLIGEYDELGNAVRQYVWLDDVPIAMLNAEGIHYLHADHLNTPRTATDGTGQVVWSANLRPFGDEVAPGGALEMPLRFPGQYHDRETGLHQNWHREYAPDIGRYTQSDPIGLLGDKNLFAYVRSNPMLYIDASGLFTCRGGVWSLQGANLSVSGFFGGGGSLSFGVVYSCSSNSNLECRMDVACIGGRILIAGGVGADVYGRATGVRSTTQFRNAVSGMFGAVGPLSGFAGGGDDVASVSKSWGGGIAYMSCFAKNVECRMKNSCNDSYEWVP